MKKIKIGEKDYLLCESVNDINDKRFNYFKIYLFKSLEGLDRPFFTDTLRIATDFFNAGKYFQAFGKFHDYYKSIEQDGYNDDALSRCFALICLRDKEDQLNVDDNFLNEKLEELWDQGLTRGFVEESVRNFTTASPDSLGSYAVAVEEMTQKFDKTFWEGLKKIDKSMESQQDSND